MYKVIVDDSNYNNWTYYNTSTLVKIELNICPISSKLFTNDIFNLVNNKVVLTHSPFKLCSHNSGILCLNQEFGSINKKKLYKCIPNDNKLPHFLIPYTILK